MTTIEYKFSEGDMVIITPFPDMGEFEICGLHTLNGANSYTINDGEKEDVKYEYQIKLIKPSKVKPRKIGFKERELGTGKPIIQYIGETKGIEISQSSE